MSKKALLITTTSGFVPQFEINSVELLKQHGYEIHYATNYNNIVHGIDNHRVDELGLIRHQIDFDRSPYKIQTFVAYKQLDKLLKEYDFDVIHCHTPMGGFLGRLAGKNNNIPKIIYTAHGFHFYKGCPKLNRLLYYPIEKTMARYTDALITINSEDFASAKKLNVKGNTYRIHGIGIDTKKFSSQYNASKIRNELGIKDNQFVLISVGEININKNQEIIIRAMNKMRDRDIVYLICGDGFKKTELIRMVKENQLEDNIRFLGYREDIERIYAASDLFVFPSFREGLPVSLMEAMLSGLPVVVSRIRGVVDLVKEEENGLLLDPGEVNEWIEAIYRIKNNKGFAKKIGERNKSALDNFDKENVKKELAKIYEEQGLFD